MRKLLKICILLIYLILSINILNAEKKKVILINNYNNKKEEKFIEINETISISSIYIQYKGEKEIHYRTCNDKLYVDGKLTGLEINHTNDFEMAEDDTIYFKIDELVDLSPLKNMKKPFYIFLKYSSFDNDKLKILSELNNLYYFSHNSTRINDKTLSYMTNLKKLEFLIIKDAKITNEGIQYLKNLNNLKYINLYSTNITDDGGMNYLTNKNIYYLNLNNTKINDEALKHIKEMKDLKILSLKDTKISNEGLKHLINLKKLEKLNLEDTEISDEGLKYISKLNNLKELNLADTNIRNDGLQYLKTLKKLEELNLEDTKVNDSGIKYLTNLSNLTALNLKDTKITNNSIVILEKLKKLNYLNIKYTGITNYKDKFSTRKTIEIFFKKTKDSFKFINLKMDTVLYDTYSINGKIISKLKSGTKIRILNNYETDIENVYVTSNKITIKNSEKSINIPKGKECIIIGFDDNIFETVFDINEKKIIIQLEKKQINKVTGYSKIITENGQKGWIITNNLE